MMHVAVMAVALAAIQDPAVESIQRAQREYRMALVELGPDAIPELERRAGGPQGQFLKEAIEEIRRMREPIEKLVAQLSAGEVSARDLAAMELLGFGRPARTYLEAVPYQRADRARVEWILRQPPFKTPRHPSAMSRELVLMREKERVEIQKLRVRAMDEELAKGKTTNLNLIKARRDLEKFRYKAGEITLGAYLATARERTAEELGLLEQQSGAGTVPGLDVLKARLQLSYLDRRLGKEAGEQIKKQIQDAARLLRLHRDRGMSGENEILEQLFQLTTDYDQDLD